MAITTCEKCGGVHFVDDTPLTIARQFVEPGQEALWLVFFMWVNYDQCHVL